MGYERKEYQQEACTKLTVMFSYSYILYVATTHSERILHDHDNVVFNIALYL